MKEEVERIVKCIKDAVRKAGANGVVLGLSGGLDSAVVAVLAKKALGGNNVHCYYMPEKQKDHDIDLEHIEKLCNRFGITFNIHTIGETTNACKDSFWRDISNWEYANIKARTRMTDLYTYASLDHCLVIGTGNRSEIMTGYFTKHGDGGVDFEPIGHLYKTEVFKLAKHLNVPNEIIDKPPSAGLVEGQTDEADLGITYVELDAILNYLHCSSLDSHSFERQGITKQNVNKVVRMIETTEHKRRLPPVSERHLSKCWKCGLIKENILVTYPDGDKQTCFDCLQEYQIKIREATGIRYD